MGTEMILNSVKSSRSLGLRYISVLSKNKAAHETKLAQDKHIKAFPLIYPDFCPSPVPNRRIPLLEQLVRADQLERRSQIDIPEFYVGSIVAVTTAQPDLPDRQNRFLGICITRERVGMHHRFTLRNCVNGLGVEVMYDLYNPTILKIETIVLEKRLDSDLSYLRDALPEYSTFDFNMEPISHPVGNPVPVNPLKVVLRHPKWSKGWERSDCKGIANAWQLASPSTKRYDIRGGKYISMRKYDLIMNWRVEPTELDHELSVEKEIRRFEESKTRQGLSKRKILKSIAEPHV